MARWNLLAYRTMASAFLLLAAESCQGGSASTTSRTPTSPTTSNDLRPECKEAAADRARVAALRDEGRLDRIARTLAHADKVCPESASSTWAVRLSVLAELGKAEEVKQLVGEVEAAQNAPADARNAARTARNSIAMQAKNPPNGSDLVQSGLAAKAKGELANAQRFFDRAMAVMEMDQAKPVRLATPIAFDGSMALSSNGQKIALSGQTSVSIRDKKTGYLETLRITDLKSNVLDIEFSRDGTILATAMQDGSVHVFDANTGQARHVLKGHREQVDDIEFSPDSQMLASASADTTVRLWNVQTGAEIRTLEGSSEGFSVVTWSPDGATVAAGTMSNQVHSWNARTGEHLREVKVAGESFDLWRLAFSTDGKSIFAGLSMSTLASWTTTSKTSKVKFSSFSPDNPQEEGQPSVEVLSSGAKRVVTSTARHTTVWDASTAQKIKVIDVIGDDPPEHIKFSQDGSILAMRFGNTSVQLLDTSTWKEIAVIRSMAAPFTFVSGVAFGDQGKTLAVSAADKTIRVWSAKGGQGLRTIERDSSTTPSIAISEDGNMIATAESWSGSGYGARVVRRVDGKEVAKLKDLSSYPAGIAFSLDGKTVLVALSYELIEWNLATGATIRKLPRVYASGYRFAFAPDRKAIFYDGTPRGAELWNVMTEKKLFDMQGHSGEIKAVAYSPRGDMVASGATDKTVRLWSTKDGELIHTFERMGGTIGAMCFTPDGATLVVAADDDSIRHFNTDTGEELKKLELMPASALTCSSQAIAWSSKDDVIRISTMDGQRSASLHVFPRRDAGYVMTNDAIEFFGSDADVQRTMVSCLAGAVVYPLDLCRERYETKGLLAGVLGAGR